MKVVSLFCGIGGFDIALERAGFTVTEQVEREPFCQRVLAARFPHATCWPDVREWTGNGDEPIDLLCGGFPCQDLSVAGKRAGLAGERSGLFWEIVRIAKAVKPTWGLFENVPGLFSAGGGETWPRSLKDFGNAGLWSATQCWTASISESRNAAAACSLSAVLQRTVSSKYSLTPKAAAGILRRAAKRGRTLPPALEAALIALASTNRDTAEKTT